MLNFGERLRYLRTQKGLSQLEFSKQVKLSKSAVNMYERGEREPSFEVLEIIADYFNVDLDYLLGKTDCRNRNKLDYGDTESDSLTPSPAAHCVPVSDIRLTDLEHEIIRSFRSADSLDRELVLRILKIDSAVRKNSSAG